ncbi:MAG TPA: FAD-binding oxidoreductase [Gemmatimonadaceae bacterium]|nr:FAD-binding oxidoreductase [Gemmatimonadaceae bacterium]
MTTEGVVAAIRDAKETRSPLRVCGRGTWLDAGRPVQASNTLSLREDSGVTSYVPGDLTLTVRAGTTLSDIERATAEHDQWLPLDPFGTGDGTIGATVSTGSAGPLAANFGLPRDLVLGLEFVTGRGDVIRSGGKVVKNVAGFDLTRLVTGSWGTLGVITEVTLRLYARPKVDRTFVIRLPRDAKQATSLLRAFLAAPLNPIAFELLSPSASRALGLGSAAVLLIRFGANEAAVDAQSLTSARLARADEIGGDVWDRLRSLESEAESVIRVSGLPAQFRDVSATILSDDIPDMLTYINPIRGSLRLVIRKSSDGTSADEASSGFDPQGQPDEHLVFEKLPPEVWADIPSSVSDSLSRGIRKAYDPNNILNPGILGD